MRNRIQSTGPPRMARDKNQFIVPRARSAPAQIMFDLRRLAVLIDPEEANIEVVPRILKIVRVAPEKCDCLLRRKHQPNIGVLLELIKMIFTALKQRYHVAPQTGL